MLPGTQIRLRVYMLRDMLAFDADALRRWLLYDG